MRKREKTIVLIFMLLLAFFIGLANVYASYVWNGYYYMSNDMLNRTILAQESMKVLGNSLLEKDRTIAVASLIEYSDYLKNEFHLEIKCFIHNKKLNDKLYNDFYPKDEIFNRFLQDNRDNLISNDPGAIKKLADYEENINLFKNNLNELRNNYPIIMPKTASIDILNPYSNANEILNKIVTSFN